MSDISEPVPPVEPESPPPLMPVAPVPTLRIKTLTLCDFRAFAGPEPVSLRLDGKNLLVYGENGSGKSSIFHALDEFFSVSPSDAAARQTRLSELRNKFSNLMEADGYIEVELNDERPAARWDHTRHPVDIAPEADRRIVNGAYRKAILDYRSLLDTNYRHGNGTINLFDTCIRVLLRDYPILHLGREERLFDLWNSLQAYLRRGQLRQRDVAEINGITASFNSGLREALDILTPKINVLLEDLGWGDVKLSRLTTPGISYNNAGLRAERDFDGREVTPVIEFRGFIPPHPQFFLNEARLSALALAIYFAGRQICANTVQAETPRLMVLDDVLIGLDQSNRLPVLQTIGRHFADWQIVLLTHDRVWFEMTRFHLADRTDWDTLELFEEIDPLGASRPLLRPKGVDPVQSNIATARNFHAAHHYPAAAVHARVAFEQSLKKVCERKAIPVRFQSDPRSLTTDDLLSAVENWLATRTMIRPLVSPAIVSIRMWRKVVLNPFSHSTPVNLSAAEVLGAIDAVEELHKAFKDHVLG